MLVGTGGLTLFPGTPLLEEAKEGKFTPLTEKEMLIELKIFVENLTGPNFLQRKEKILEKLNQAINYGDEERMATIHRHKKTLSF